MAFSKKRLISLSLITSIAIYSNADTNTNIQVNTSAILDAYSNIALDTYTKTLDDAKALKVAIDN